MKGHSSFGENPLISHTTGDRPRGSARRWLVGGLRKLGALAIIVVLGVFIRGQVNMNAGPGPDTRSTVPISEIGVTRTAPDLPILAPSPIVTPTIAVATSITSTTDCLDWSTVKITQMIEIRNPTPSFLIFYTYPGNYAGGDVTVPKDQYSQERMRGAICAKEMSRQEEKQRTDEANRKLH